jgi:O-antigen ligase
VSLAGAALAGVLVVCAVVPPDVNGSALAVAGALVALAALLTSREVAATPGARAVWIAVPVAVFAARAALAPGAAVEPAAVATLAVVAGLAAWGARESLEGVAPIAAGAVLFVGGRALYETLWGLDAWAARVRAMAPGTDAAAVLNRLGQGRPYGGFTTPAALGCFLAIGLPAVVSWSLGRTGRARVLGLACALAGAGGLFATRSMTAMAALAVAIALAAARGRISPRVLAGVALVIGGALLAAGLARPDAVFVPTSQDSPWRLRAGNIRIALEIARDHPLAGVGPGGYAEAFPGYRRDGDNESRHAHDLPAELVAEWGIPAGLVLAALFFWIFLAPVTAAAAPPKTFASGLSIGLAAFALHNLVDFTAFLPSLLLAAAVLRGLLGGRAAGPLAGRVLRAAWVGLACFIALVVSGSGLAKDALFDARTAAVDGARAEALRSAGRAAVWAPWDPDPPLFAAEARIDAGDAAASVADAGRAVRRAPTRPSARWARAQARAATGDAAGAFADLVEASRLYPMHADYARQRDQLGEALRKASEAAPR